MDNIFKLIKKQFNGALTPNEEQELQAWYNNNANNQRTYTCYYATLKLFRIKQKEKHFTARVSRLTTAYIKSPDKKNIP